MVLRLVRGGAFFVSCPKAPRKVFSRHCFDLSIARKVFRGPATSRRYRVYACSAGNGREIVEFVHGRAPRADYDSICVLGGGYHSDGTLPPLVQRRLDLSHSLIERQSPSCSLLCVGGGTPHRAPVLDKDGHVMHESTLLASHLIELGVDPKRILEESASYDTVGNAYFTLTTHVIPAQWKRLAVVTSDFHMPRAMALFTDIFALAQPVLDYRVQLEFFGASDKDVLPPAVLQARQQREAESLDAWKENSSKLKTLSAFHRWLHATHRCYAVPRQHEFTDAHLDASTRQSY